MATQIPSIGTLVLLPDEIQIPIFSFEALIEQMMYDGQGRRCIHRPEERNRMIVRTPLPLPHALPVRLDRCRLLVTPGTGEMLISTHGVIRDYHVEWDELVFTIEALRRIEARRDVEVWDNARFCYGKGEIRVVVTMPKTAWSHLLEDDGL